MKSFESCIFFWVGQLTAYNQYFNLGLKVEKLFDFLNSLTNTICSSHFKKSLKIQKGVIRSRKSKDQTTQWPKEKGQATI